MPIETLGEGQVTSLMLELRSTLTGLSYSTNPCTLFGLQTSGTEGA
jgi:hypothetical protein